MGSRVDDERLIFTVSNDVVDLVPNGLTSFCAIFHLEFSEGSFPSTYVGQSMFEQGVGYDEIILKT